MSPVGREGPKDWAPQPLPVDDERVRRLVARIEKAVEDADMAFWAEIAKAFPEVKSGDFPPDATFKWRLELLDAVLTWLTYNHPARRPVATLADYFSNYASLPR